jgi:hypothetical protein
MNQPEHQIIKNTITELINNISFLKNKQREKINIILDSGLFNGAYIIGSLYFLKELEKKQYVKIDKISGCSIGSIIAVLYYVDLLDSFNDIYNMGVDELIKNNIFNVDIMINILKEKLPENICHLVNKKLYISYYDLKLNKKIVRTKYKNKDDIIETIIRSCCFPLLLNGNILYKNRYIDGIFPYIFPESNINNIKTKNLFIDLYGFDKIWHALSIKNEKTSFHRVLGGILDIHLFYIKETPTSMCSYTNKWTFINKILYHFIRQLIEYILYIITYIYYFIKNNLTSVQTRIYLKKIFIMIFQRILKCNTSRL